MRDVKVRLAVENAVVGRLRLHSSCICVKGHITEQEFMDFNVFLEHLDELEVAMNLVMQANGVNKGALQKEFL